MGTTGTRSLHMGGNGGEMLDYPFDVGAGAVDVRID
jgi:hypothetical protein